ncbi:hypothetical protein, variant 4 [Aphanomyces astaci]|uniref:Polycystin domain-containing protein n=2 Tax=Aphanomyces astaci TaxID=112090 RepID=W4FQX9_APHAT|nr:hypothetical protein, variant 3 [Aphanomyces astaci]XP_009841321.1 hypothetical protein, variant 4 [Aphanomyces astaci]ETV69214.1 hypothetical protein, variant 3 [Aphanomyces astaci]ETV69215.1 hypothetical protein, variant 4 [Aphanomyces astaci]|eukprot:XP_009841320.1 hypothetical protein, variant 3 [Aphanomyces astaci]
MALPPLQAWLLWVALLIATTLASSSDAGKTFAPLSVFSAPICRFTARPCVRLIDRNASDIIALPMAAWLPRQFAVYAPLTSSSTCPTNHSICVPTSAYVPTLTRLSSGDINLTIALLDSDVVADTALTFTLSSSTFVHGPSCSPMGTCNDSMWTISSPSSPFVVTFVVTNATGSFNVTRTPTILASMNLAAAAILPASNMEFSPTVSFETDPTCMRLSMYLPRTLSALSLCLSLDQDMCRPHNDLPSTFPPLSWNASSPASILQGSASVRVNVTTTSATSFCLTLQWDPHDVAMLQSPLGLSFPNVHLTANATSVSSPLYMQWTVQGTESQCVPVVFLQSPRAADLVEPQTLWTVVSLVLYTFAFVVACLLVRLHGLSFVKTSMFHDLALVSLLLVLLTSLLVHVLWLTTLHRLTGDARGTSGIEAGFLVAIVEGLRQTLLWVFVVSAGVHWTALSTPGLRRIHMESGRVVGVWVLVIISHFVVLLLYVVQNYSVLKCTYVDYLRNSAQTSIDRTTSTTSTIATLNSTTQQLWLPLLQPADWKYGVDKVCVDRTGGAFVLTFVPLHLLPLVVLVGLVVVGCSTKKTPTTTSSSTSTTTTPMHDDHVPLPVVSGSPNDHRSRTLSHTTTTRPPFSWISRLCAVLGIMPLAVHHFLTLYLYATSQHLPPVMWLVVGEYLPMLAPTLGYLVVQWTSSTGGGGMLLDTRLSHMIMRSTNHEQDASEQYRMPQDDTNNHDDNVITSSSLKTTSVAHVAVITSSSSMGQTTACDKVVVHLSHVVDDDPGWSTTVHTSKDELVTIPWYPDARIRCIVTTVSHMSAVESVFELGSLRQASHHVTWKTTCDTGTVTISLVRVDKTVTKPVSFTDPSVDSVAEELRELPWPTAVAVQYVATCVLPTVSVLADRAAEDLAATCAPTPRPDQHPIDQIQDEWEADVVQTWLRQRWTKRAEYAAMLTTGSSIPATMLQRLDEGKWVKLTADAKTSALRFLPCNLHVQDLHVIDARGEAAAVYSTLTMGVFASDHPTLADTEGSPQHATEEHETTWHARYKDEVQWATWVRETETNGQALATVVTAVVDQLNTQTQAASRWMEWVATKSVVFHMESLVSDHGKERQMLRDCAAAMEWLQSHVTLGLELEEEGSNVYVVNQRDVVTSVNLVVQASDPSHMNSAKAAVHVVLRVRERFWNHVHELIGGGPCHDATHQGGGLGFREPPNMATGVVRITALLFTQGIDESQTLANKTGGLFKETFPDVVNQRSVDRLAAFVQDLDVYVEANMAQKLDPTDVYVYVWGGVCRCPQILQTWCA